MKRKDRIAAFISLGKEINSFLQGGDSLFSNLLELAITNASTVNLWFTKESILNSLKGIVFLLEWKVVKQGQRLANRIMQNIMSYRT